MLLPWSTCEIMQKLRMWLGGISWATANSSACWSVAADASRREQPHGGRFEAPPAERTAKAEPRLQQRVTLCMWQQPQRRAGSGSSGRAAARARRPSSSEGRTSSGRPRNPNGEDKKDKITGSLICPIASRCQLSMQSCNSSRWPHFGAAGIHAVGAPSGEQAPSRPSPPGCRLLSACDGRMWEYALGCAGRRKTSDSLCCLGDVPSLSHLRYSDGGVDSTPASSPPIPVLLMQEVALSDASTREASLRDSPSASIRASPTPKPYTFARHLRSSPTPSLWSHGSSDAGSALFIAIPQSGSSPSPKRVKAAADRWSAPCAACCDPIAGAPVFMGGGRAYCSAAACQKSWLHELPASALAAVGPARMGPTPVGLLCGAAAGIAPHSRRTVPIQATRIERGPRRQWQLTRARSKPWLRESRNYSRESTIPSLLTYIFPRC